jgi:predicted RecA/RadA family phage recombinase
MKKSILSAALAAIIVLAGCKSGGGDPKTVLSGFFDAISKKDFTTAKKLATKDSEGMMGMMQMAMQSIPDTSEMMKFSRENLEMGDAVINGDMATIPVKEKRSGETTDFTLKKEDGSWKVAFDKSTLMQMGQKKMKEHGLNGMMNHGMDDSIGNINGGSLPNEDSVSNEEMQKAREMMDSANKILKDAK